MIKYPISVIIHTKNAQETVGAALESVAGWAREVIVADMHSADRTREIARQYQAKIITVADAQFADPARNEIVNQAKNDWILVVDADESVPESLIPMIAERLDKPAEVWMVPRKNLIFGKWIQHAGWWPDYQAHLFRKGRVTWLPEVHRQPEVKGKVDYLPAEERAAKIHLNYANIEDFINRMNTYTSLEIKGTRGKLGDDPIKAWGDDFLRRYFQNQGYLDQTHGLFLSFLQGFYEATRSLKAWQAQGFPENPEAQFSMGKFIQNLKYWEANRQLAGAVGFKAWWWRLRRKFKV